MKNKKASNLIGYRASEEVLKFMEDFIGQNPVLSKSQVVEIALRHFSRMRISERRALICDLGLGRTEDLQEEKRGHVA